MEEWDMNGGKLVKMSLVKQIKRQKVGRKYELFKNKSV